MPITPGQPVDRDKVIDLEQVCARIVSVAYDNGRTPGSSEGPTRPGFIRFDWVFTDSSFDLNCEAIDTGPIGPFTGWTPQLQGWADAFNAVMPANYFAAFGFKPAPTWRYTKVTTCDPTAVFGPWTITRDTFPDEPYNVFPVCKQEQKVLAWRYFTLDKDGSKELHWCEPNPDDPTEFIESESPMWEPIEGDGLVPIPLDCFVACDFQFGDCTKGEPEVACTSRILDDTYCDKVYASEPDEEDQTVQEDIFIEFIQCEDGTTYTDYFLIVDNGPVPYVPQGEIVDCETCLPPVIVPECPEGAVFECVEVPGDYEFILDNSLWNDGVANPLSHLPKNADMVIAICDASGNEISRSGPLAEPYFNALINGPFPDCSIVPVCANHTSPSGCNIGHVANLAAFPHYDSPTAPGDVQNNLANPAQSELWATGWGVRCSGCGPEPAQAKVVDANAANASFIGIAKNLIVYRGETQTLFRAVTCHGIYWKDCDGNDVPAPASGCCATPKGPTVTEDKQVIADSYGLCAFLDGETSNCAEENVTEWRRRVVDCYIDGAFISREITDLQLDGVTPFDADALPEAAAIVRCQRDEDGNLLICNETCYQYSPPVVVRPPIKAKSVEAAVKQIRTLSAKKSARALTEREQAEGREAQRVVEVALTAVQAEEQSEPLGFARGDCLKVVHCCPCGDPENIVSETYSFRPKDAVEFEPIDAFEVAFPWVEKPCDPALDCPTEDLVDLGECTLAALEEIFDNCQYRCSFAGVGTDRNGIRNGFQTTGFVVTLTNGSTYTGATFSDLTTAMEADGYSLDCECESAECHISTLVITGPEEVQSVAYTNAQSGAITLTEPVCIQVPCGWQLTQELIDLGTPCCDPRIVTDAICFESEVTLGTLVVPAGEPVIRQVVYNRKYNSNTCACEDLPGDGALSYYNFLDPTEDLTEEVVTSGVSFSICTPIENVTQELCDDKGNRYQIVTLTVGANGGVATTQIYNEQGSPVAQPENLQPCPGNLNAECGCIRNADGSIALRNVHEWTGVNEAGGKIHGGYTVGPALQVVTLEPGQIFTCDCKDKCDDTVGQAKYAYDMSGEGSFPCSAPTITIDGEIVELCDSEATGPAAIPSTGDLHTVGGVRSTNTPGRCDPAGTTDPSGLAAELQNFGSVGDETVNPNATLTNTANAHIAVRNTFPVSGTATSIDFTATWNVGSGIAVMAYDCSDGVELTPTSNLSSFNECRPSTRGPVDAWGGGNNGQTLTTTWTKPGNASFDLEDIVFVTIVNNPPGDHLSAIMVNGESPGASGCVADSVGDLATLIGQETGLAVTVVDGVLCIVSDKPLGPITCGTGETQQIYEPTVTDLSVDIQADFVALAPKSIDALACAIAEKMADLLMVDKPDEEKAATLCLADGKTANPACTTVATKRVYKDWSHKGGETSQATLDAVTVEVTTDSCSAFNQTFTNFGAPGPQDVADNVNTNFETWINDNLGPLGFAAVPATVLDAANSNSPMTAFADLTYPTCEPWQIDMMFVPTHYSGAPGPFSGIRYRFDGASLIVEVLDAAGNVTATPPPNTAGNLGGLSLCP